MSQTLLEKMVEEARKEIKKVNKQPLSSDQFIRVLYSVMRTHSEEIGNDWHAVFYSLVRAMRENVKHDWKVLQAARLQEEELHRLDGVHYDEKTGCIFGLGECELEEAI